MTDSRPTERLMFILRCPVCDKSVTAFNDGPRWRILVHRVNGEWCAGSGKALKTYRRKAKR